MHIYEQLSITCACYQVSDDEVVTTTFYDLNWDYIWNDIWIKKANNIWFHMKPKKPNDPVSDFKIPQKKSISLPKKAKEHIINVQKKMMNIEECVSKNQTCAKFFYGMVCFAVFLII